MHTEVWLIHGVRKWPSHKLLYVLELLLKLSGNTE